MNKNIAIKMISTAGLALGFSAGSVFAQQNLIVNGSFESGGAGIEHFPGWDAIGPANNNSDYGVAQSSVSPDVAEQGNFFAYFHGHPTDSSQDCLGQTVHLTVGAQYTISYYMATDGSTLGFDATSAILVDNVSMTLVPPQLSLKLAPTNMLSLTWAAPTNGYRLQANASLTRTNWVTLTNTPVTVGSSNQVFLPEPARDMFYRLTLP